MPLNNFALVDQNMVRAIYRSSQPSEYDGAWLHDIGITTIFKLNTEQGDEINWPQFDIHYSPLPSSFYDVVLVEWIAREIYNALSNPPGNPQGQGDILIHCQHGRDRTGLVVAAYRMIYQGWTLEVADAERTMFGVEGIQAILDFPLTEQLVEIDRRRRTA